MIIHIYGFFKSVMGWGSAKITQMTNDVKACM